MKLSISLAFPFLVGLGAILVLCDVLTLKICVSVLAIVYAVEKLAGKLTEKK